jgi:hypothetical protein
MNVIVTQHGNPPSTLTKARVIAPQAAKYLADLFADKTFADSVVVVIDWVGDLFWDQAEAMPEELKTPIMAVICEKRYPMLNNQLLTVDYKLELEDFFGHDNATKDDLHEIVGNMEAKVRAEENRRGI